MWLRAIDSQSSNLNQLYLQSQDINNQICQNIQNCRLIIIFKRLSLNQI